MLDRRTFLLSAGAVATWSGGVVATVRDSSRDFEFLMGDWQVQHRFLRRGAAGLEWAEGEGVCRQRPLAGGWGNIEEHVIRTDRGVHQAVGVRTVDPADGTWSAWWLDERDPGGPMDPPPRGKFSSGVATFVADTSIDGRLTRERLIWSQITASSARWEQAYSVDAGKTWETNWIMKFKRARRRDPISLVSSAINVPARSADFDFLVGEWDVHHRRLLPDGSRWVEFDGTCSNRPLMEGRANMEEHFLPAPTGAYRALGLRSYDPVTRQWAIRWFDQRVPRGPIDPPDRGGFEGGKGAFHSEIELNGVRVRGRLSWSDITDRSAHWEQAISRDGGQTWSTNWLMDFHRRTAG
jgi:hypothetical protein